jgi:tetratricopeptide (TPR) repeat protein
MRRTSTPQSEPAGEVARARAACAARDWEAGHALLRAADARGALDAEGLELLADCARWTGRPAELFDPLERAHADHVARGDLRGAVRTAHSLCQANGDAANPSVAAAWLQGAAALLAHLPEGAEHARQAWFEGQAHALRGEIAAQERCAQRALELACRHGDRDVEALSRIDLAHVAGARAQPGVAREHLERATTLALGGEIGILASGMVFCSAIWAYRCQGEWQRAQEWTDSSTRWVRRQQVDYFPGMCRVHRAEVLRIRGDLERAERECAAAAEQVTRALPGYAVFPWAELGEIRRRRGNLAGAREAFQRALELGWDPQPGFALLLLAQGDAAAALQAIERALGDPRPLWLSEDRTSLLAARAEIALAAGRRDLALAAVEELESTMERNGTSWDVASACCARARLELDAARPAAAVVPLRRARRAWAELDAPYELARTSALLGRAIAAQGDAAGARIELEAAREILARIGAALEAEPLERELAALAGRDAPRTPPGAPLRGRLRREGESWTIALDGRSVSVRTSRGMEYLAALLERPGVAHWAVDLAGAGLQADAGPVLDPAARAAYQRRAEELEEELLELDRHSQAPRVEAILTELDALGRELAAAVGLGGRSRRPGGSVERARQSVTKALRSAIRRIAVLDARLGTYLEVTIRTGTACRFEPDLRESVEWSVERGAA